MKPFEDPELNDVLQDVELQQFASLLSSAKVPEPPLDEAFRSGLRRQLMTEAWTMAEGRGAVRSRLREWHGQAPPRA
jgi:hypothetical protein